MKTHKIIKTLLSFVAILGLFTSFAFAEEDFAGGQGGAFLRIPVGARPAGLGNAFTAIADDGSAPFYNPAGLCQIKGTRLGAMYNIMSLDRMNYQASIIVGSSRNAALAVTFNSIGVNDIIECLPGQGPSGNTFSSNDMAIGISAGGKIIPLLSIGAGAKYLTQSIDDNKGTGFAFDLGALVLSPVSSGLIKQIRAGASLLNLGGKMKWDTDSDHEDEILPMLRLGASADLQLTSFDVIGTAEISQSLGREGDQKNDFKLHLGVEGWLANLFAVRAGLDGEDFTMGASIVLSDFRFDYAYIPDFLDEGATHKLAIDIGF